MIDRRLVRGATDDLSHLIGGALDSIDRATALSRRILDVAGLDEDTYEVVRPDQVVFEMMDIIVLAAGLSVVVEFVNSGAVSRLLCQRIDLENIILNLVVNARDAMDGVGSLKISLGNDAINSSHDQRTAAARPDIVLSVTDTGSGMTPDTLAKAFLPFFTTKAPGKGTGVGLATVAAFARRLGGSATIETTLGEGTAIILRLPTH